MGVYIVSCLCEASEKLRRAGIMEVYGLVSMAEDTVIIETFGALDSIPIATTQFTIKNQDSASCPNSLSGGCEAAC